MIVLRDDICKKEPTAAHLTHVRVLGELSYITSSVGRNSSVYDDLVLAKKWKFISVTRIGCLLVYDM